MHFKTLRRALLVLALLVPMVSSLSAQVAAQQEESTQERIEELLIEAYPDTEGPGAALLVTEGGEVLFRGARGMANVELGVPLSADQVFRLGSITKQFTGAAVMILEERGLLSVEDSITKYLPDFPTHGYEITIEHLLSHTSGIFNYTNTPGFMGNPSRADVSTEELVATFRDLDLDFAPGERWSYSNSGYVLLGAIIEEVTGQSYAEFVRESIFEPLGMRDSYYGGHQLIPGRVSGYALEGEGYVNAPYISMTVPHAAGSLLSTVDDLARWHRALVSGELISEASYRRMTTPVELDNGEATEYGYGFNVARVRGLPAIHHGGGIHGFATFALYLPEQDIYVTALSNIPGGGMGPGPLAIQVGALVAGKPFPRFEPVSVGEEILSRYVGVYRIDEHTTRTVEVEGGKLYTRRTGGDRLEATPHSETGFFYEGMLTHFEIVLGDEGEVRHMLMYQDGSDVPERAVFTDEKPLETPVRVEIELDPSLYDRYVGRYELAPGFVLNVTRVEDRIFAQATGQQRAEIYPSSETEFFLKVVDAQLVFDVGDDGNAVAVTLHQAGQVIRGGRLSDQ